MFGLQGLTRQSYNDDGTVVLYWGDNQKRRQVGATFHLQEIEQVALFDGAGECITSDGDIGHYYVIDSRKSSR
jgi:hypothetical protein